MGHQIIKQPNGTYAIWSSVVDSFIVTDCTQADLVEHFLERERDSIERHVTRVLDDLNAGKPPYAQFTLTFDEAVQTIRELHGNDAEALQVLGLAAKAD